MRQISNSVGVRDQAMLARALVLLAAIGPLLCADRALAEPELSLTWSAGEPLSTCPDHAWAMTRIASEIGRAPSAQVPEGVHAIVTIEKRAAGFRLSLRSDVGSAHGQREIEGDNCSELSEAAILIIALSVAEAGEARQRESTSPPTSPKEGSENKAPESESVQTGRRTAATRLGVLLRPELVVELGLLQSPTLGPGLAFGLEWGRFRVELAGTWPLSGEMETAGEQIALRLGAARVSGCALFGVGRVRGGPCLGVELGDVRGRNTETGVQNHTLWAAASATGRLWVALGWRLALVFDVDMVASWGQLRWYRTQEDGQRTTLFSSQPVQLRTHLGLELSF
jgi:hypothetical protein